MLHPKHYFALILNLPASHYKICNLYLNLEEIWWICLKVCLKNNQLVLSIIHWNILSKMRLRLIVNFPFSPQRWHEWKWNPQDWQSTTQVIDGPRVQCWHQGWEVSSLRRWTWSRVPQALTKDSPPALKHTILASTVFTKRKTKNKLYITWVPTMALPLAPNWGPRRYHCHHIRGPLNAM